MPSEQECCYMAGVLDTEAFIGIDKRYKRNGLSGHLYNPVIKISQTKYEWVKSIQFLWGGGISTHTRGQKSNKRNWADAWQIQFSGNAMRSLLEATRPYLKQKGEQADLCLELHTRIIGQGKGRGKILTADEQSTRGELYQRCKLLNQRGRRNEQLELELLHQATNQAGI